MTLVLLIEDERYPTLNTDDCLWRGESMGSEPPGFYPHEQAVEVPQELLDRLNNAHSELRAAEDAIRALAL